MGINVDSITSVPAGQPPVESADTFGASVRNVLILPVMTDTDLPSLLASRIEHFDAFLESGDVDTRAADAMDLPPDMGMSCAFEATLSDP